MLLSSNLNHVSFMIISVERIQFFIRWIFGGFVLISQSKLHGTKIIKMFFFQTVFRNIRLNM